MNRAKTQYQFNRFVQAFVAGSLLSVSATFAAGPAAASSGGGGGGHAAAAAPAETHAAPSAAAPGANPTTPAGAHESAPVSSKQPAVNGAAAATDNGASFHRHHYNNPQYQGVYENSWLPDATGFYGNNETGTNGYGNNTNNTNADYSTDNSTPAPAPAPVTVTPANNSTSAAAQEDNAIDHAPQTISVNAAIQRAQAAVDADRERVIASLASKPEYQQALARQKNASTDMSDVKPLGAGTPGTPAPAVMNAAAAKLDASDEVTKIQEAAIAADPQAAKDKDALTKLAAAKDVQEARMRSQH